MMPSLLQRRAAAALVLALALPLPACGAGGEEPTVSVMSASPLELDPARDDADDLTVRVAYTDPDGDLGGGVARIHDCRAEGLVFEVPLPTIASQEAVDQGVSIEGELALVVTDVGAAEALPEPPAACRELGVGAPSGGAQALCVVLVDAAGHASEGDCTDAIRVLPAGP